MTHLNADVASVILEFANYFHRVVLFDILFPGSKLQCYKRNIRIIKKEEDIEYRLFDKLHRENDLPAIIWDNGTKEWWFKGKCHRDGDLPAIIYTSHSKIGGLRENAIGMEIYPRLYTQVIQKMVV
jgi:hypothetical protein